MKHLAVILCTFVAWVTSGAVPKPSQTETTHGTEKQDSAFAGRKSYQGQYQGKCGNDGFYYNDELSIVMCSNGNAYIQPCAPGSKNSPQENYQQGDSYYYHDFCDVNLVDDGYTLMYGYSNSGIKEPSMRKSFESSVHYGENKNQQEMTGAAYGGASLYHGQYQGKCGKDGFYYNNDASFVMCSNGNAYIQPCAPGSKNSAYNNYQHGNSYYSRDFCDINLVDDGYTLNFGSHKSGYEATDYKVQHAGYASATFGNNDGGYQGNSYDTEKGYRKSVIEVPQPSHGRSKQYHGQYQGKCGNDGFYYNDDASFVICSNGNAYIQPCAPGSKNSAYNNYQSGDSYNYRDFCDINLVDDGFTLQFGSSKGIYQDKFAGSGVQGYSKGSYVQLGSSKGGNYKVELDSQDRKSASKSVSTYTY